MSPTVLKAISVRCFELFNSRGESLGLFKVAEEWEGLIKLEAVNDESNIVIASVDGGMLAELFSKVFGEYRADIAVIKATPSLLGERS